MGKIFMQQFALSDDPHYTSNDVLAATNLRICFAVDLVNICEYYACK